MIMLETIPKIDESATINRIFANHEIFTQRAQRNSRVPMKKKCYHQNLLMG